MNANMKFVKLTLDKNYGDYSYSDSNDIQMAILGYFLTDDVGNKPIPYKNWATDRNQQGIGGNHIFLEKENEFIILNDLYPEDNTATELRMSRQQFLEILDKWGGNICIEQPPEVIIKHEDGEYIIETRDTYTPNKKL
jgi:hypothetical protein